MVVMMQVFKDFLKRDLAIEDFVVFPGPYNSGMKLGQVVKFTPQNVKIRWTRKGYRDQVETEETLRRSSECVKVEGADLTFYLLSGEY
jgi:hypothetical protein